jgi:hypothetical protein
LLAERNVNNRIRTAPTGVVRPNQSCRPNEADTLATDAPEHNCREGPLSWGSTVTLLTPVCDLFGIEFPIFCAGIGIGSEASLATAVSNARDRFGSRLDRAVRR